MIREDVVIEPLPEQVDVRELAVRATGRFGPAIVRARPAPRLGLASPAERPAIAGPESGSAPLHPGRRATILMVGGMHIWRTAGDARPDPTSPSGVFLAWLEAVAIVALLAGLLIVIAFRA